MTNASRTLTMASALLLGCRVASAIINPQFTPLHLLHESDVVAVGVLEQGTDATSWRLQVGETLKGAKSAAISLSLGDCDEPQRSDMTNMLSGRGRAPVIFFAGGPAGERHGRLHVGRIWFKAAPAKDGAWNIESVDFKMSETFEGSTEMLIRMIRYLQAYPDDTVPVAAGMSWSSCLRIGNMQAGTNGLDVVQLSPGGPLCLFAASPEGDRLFRAEPKEDRFTDITDAATLNTRSKAFAWVDMNRDGIADLVTWDGKAVTVRTVKDGRLLPADDGSSLDLPPPCFGIAVAGLQTNGAVRLLIGTPAGPLVASVSGTPATWSVATLPLPPGASTQDGCACVVADLDNDGLPDVLEPRKSGGLLWRGTADGFAAPTRSAVSCKNPRASRTLGDFDMDGFLDVFVSDDASNQLWENDGKAGFRDMVNEAGSLSYKAPPSASDCKATDLNHDGRQDLLVCYADGDVNYHFNRGYRCMGEQGALRLGELEEFSGGVNGVRACAVADFGGDGAEDLAIATSDGVLWCLQNSLLDAPGIRLRLPKGQAGPVTVSAWQGEGDRAFCTGTHELTGGAPARFVSTRSGGSCTLKWSIPGRPNLSRTIDSTEGLPEVVLESK